MAKVKKVKEEVVTTDETVEVSFPVVVGNKRFQSVSFNKGFVVYNPSGDRVSNILTKEKAEDLVREMNRQAGLK